MQICVHTYRFNLIKADFQVDWMTTQLNSFQNMLILSRGGEHVLLTLQNWFGLPNRSHRWWLVMDQVCTYPKADLTQTRAGLKSDPNLTLTGLKSDPNPTYFYFYIYIFLLWVVGTRKSEFEYPIQHYRDDVFNIQPFSIDKK